MSCWSWHSTRYGWRALLLFVRVKSGYTRARLPLLGLLRALLLGPLWRAASLAAPRAGAFSAGPGSVTSRHGYLLAVYCVRGLGLAGRSFPGGWHSVTGDGLPTTRRHAHWSSSQLQTLSARSLWSRLRQSHDDYPGSIGNSLYRRLPAPGLLDLGLAVRI